jgi:DNA-binding CsgD family transcriptional regulator
LQKTAKRARAAPAHTPQLRDAALAAMVGTFADVCQTATSLEHIETELTQRLAPFGVTHFVHVQALDRRQRPSGALMAGPSNAAWRQLYIDRNWAPQDDLMKSGLQRLLPVTWQAFQREGAVSDGQQQIFRHAHEFGFHDGYFLPIHLLDGSVACVSFFSECTLPERGFSAAALHMLALYYSCAVRRILGPAATETRRVVSLTPRQKECLQWVRAGKTDWEIGQIIGISEHTVIEHLDQARRRLGVRTRTQAVIEAVSLGHIHL